MKNIKKIVVISGVVVIMFCGYGVTTEVTDTKKENKNLINKYFENSQTSNNNSKETSTKIPKKISLETTTVTSNELNNKSQKENNELINNKNNEEYISEESSYLNNKEKNNNKKEASNKENNKEQNNKEQNNKEQNDKEQNDKEQNDKEQNDKEDIKEEDTIITEEEAEKIIQAQLKEEYLLEINNINFEMDGESYYQYLINYNDITSQDSIIINKKSKKIMCYRVDGVTYNFEESQYSKDYNKENENNYNLDGKFYSEDKTETLELNSINKSSFNFNLEYYYNSEKEHNSGIADISNNIALCKYNDEKIIEFIFGNDFIEVNIYDKDKENIFHRNYYKD